jgi:hypothetical protein
MDLGSIFLGLALLAIVAFVVARPMLLGGPDRERAERGGQADQLLFERERLLAQLRDLDFDQATGKLAADDYAAQRAGLVAQGVAVLKQLDALGVSTAPANGAAHAVEDDIEAAIAAARSRWATAPAPAATMEDSIEARVAARRSVVAPAEGAALACANCGAGVESADRYCPQCGATQAVACGNCGRPARVGDQFCGGCGQRLPEGGSLN